jgi:hypothetical protein
MSLVGVVEGVVAIDEKILERGGDYLLAVKENQPSLAEALREFFDEGKARGYVLRRDETYPKRSIRSRRKTAERLPDYRVSLLGLVQKS